MRHTVHLAIAALILFGVASPAIAEVMDKEPTSGDILSSLAIHAAIALVAALAWRWLLLPSSLAFVLSAPVFAWTECHNEFVGPAILREAGPGYCTLANLAVAIGFAVHGALWVAVSHLKRYRGHNQTGVFASPKTLGFAIALVCAVLLGSAAGFSHTETRIWWSPPIAVQALYLGAVSLLFVRGRSERAA